MLLFFSTGDFKSAQLKHERVKEAYQNKEKSLQELYETKGVDFLVSPVFLRVFKAEKELELWAKNSKGIFVLIKQYKICSASGDLGPKRKMGDYQVPEGYYHIDRFNPTSSFHLSLGLNYPNASDKVLSDQTNPGGDIFIHGSCVSIGCMAMTNERIKEIYIAAVQAKNAGQSKVAVHIYPFRMTQENMAEYSAEYKENAVLIAFWKNIKKGFDHFEKTKTLPVVSVNAKGSYIYQ